MIDRHKVTAKVVEILEQGIPAKVIIFTLDFLTGVWGEGKYKGKMEMTETMENEQPKEKKQK